MDVEIEKPQPSGRDLLIAIKAIAINPVDTKIRASKDTIEPSPKVLGWDAAGIVEAVGPDASLFKPGDEVYYAGDITRPGTILNSNWSTSESLVRNPRLSVSLKPQRSRRQRLPLTKHSSIDWALMLVEPMRVNRS